MAALISHSRQADPWVRVFDVTEPSKHHKGHTVYKVISKVFPRNLVEAVTQVIVWKRYNDFKKLHKALHTIHQALHLKGTFPPFAKARLFGRFDAEVVEERRRCALNLLEFASLYPALYNSQVFVKFFEGGQEVKFPPEKPLSLVDPIQPLKLSPRASPRTTGASKNSSPDVSRSDVADPNGILGGIWRHHQDADEISLSSQATDDDRTTFTDDDSALGTPLPSNDLALFDPLAESMSGTDPLSALPDGKCTNSWLLSAIEACSRLESPDPLENTPCSTPDIFTFPKPFSDAVDFADSPETSWEGTGLQPATSTLPLFSSSRSDPLTSDIAEFDPLAVGNMNVKAAPELAHAVRDDTETSSPCNAIALSPSPLVLDVGADHGYLLTAADLVGQAQQNEACGDFAAAFAFYKSAIGTLLQGVQGESSSLQREAVRRKTAQYLLRAEEIYTRHLSDKVQDDKRWATNGHISPARMVDNHVGPLRGSVEELANYKVLGVTGRVLLVLNIVTHQTFVIKALYKSPNKKASGSPNIVPQDIPYVVQLHRVYETDYAIFLVLQYATGGRLWDYVSSYLQRSPFSPCMDCAYPSFQQDVMDKGNLGDTESNNVYLGKKLIEPKPHPQEPEASLHNSLEEAHSSDSSVDVDLQADARCPPSYVALFTNYHVSEEDDVNKVSGSGTKSGHNSDSQDITGCKKHERPCFVSGHPNTTVDGAAIKDLDCSRDEAAQLCPSSEFDSNCATSGQLLQYSHSHTWQETAPGTPRSNKLALDVEQLINDAKALLQNVDATLQATKEIAPSWTVADLDNTLTVRSTEKCHPQQPGTATKTACQASQPISSAQTSTRKEPQNRKSPKHRPGPILTRRSSQLQYQLPEAVPTDGRMCRSSSTGSLQLAASQRVRHFSEVFRQLDVAASKMATTAAVHLPESCVRLWVSEMVVALSHLHNLGIVWQDLKPDNVLLGNRGHILLTYQSHWNCLDQIISDSARENMYAAPEIGGIFPVQPACDWWSLGALTFELLSGRTLSSCHPGGINSHTDLNIPAHISDEAKDMLQKLLRCNPSERLGTGPHGIEDVKAHPFFHGVNWSRLCS